MRGNLSNPAQQKSASGYYFIKIIKKNIKKKDAL